MDEAYRYWPELPPHPPFEPDAWQQLVTAICAAPGWVEGTEAASSEKLHAVWDELQRLQRAMYTHS